MYAARDAGDGKMRRMLEAIPGMARQIESVDRIVAEALASGSRHVARVSDYLLASRGKGLRPALVLLWSSVPRRAERSDGGYGETSVAADVAAAAELIHMASLVHDDLIDGAAIRRGRETVNARFGPRPSVLTGDFLFARAFGLLAKHKDLGVIELMTDAISAMCEGELEQAGCLFSLEETEAGYLRRIARKTASLLAACCEAGGAIAGAAADDLESARTYGLELGVAFQLTDDVLDFVADPRELGKPICQDLACGIVTLPVMRLLSHEALGPKARGIIESRQLDPESLSWVRSAVLECGGIDYARRKAVESLEKAAACAARLAAGPSRDALTAIARAIATRNR